MFNKFSLAGNLIVLVLTLSTISGCQILETLHQSPTAERFLGTVRTGGPLATARTVPIPLEGLTLAEAVEGSIRPGLIDRSGSGVSTIQQKIGPASGTVGSHKITPSETIKSVVGKIQRPAIGDGSLDRAVKKAAAELAKLNDKSPDREAKLLARLQKAETDGLLPAVDSNASEDKFTALYSDLASITDAAIETAQKSQESQQFSATAMTDKVAVRLTRRNGSRIIIPLPMVRAYSAGDIWLSDSDQIQIMPLTMTEAGQQLPNLGSNSVSQYDTASTLPSTNLLTLVHRSIVDGQVEQYLLPATNTDYYGNVAFVRQWQGAIRVHDGDELRAGTLELSPIIRKSQINTVAASAAALEERMHPTTRTLRQTLSGNLTRTAGFVAGLPGINQVRNQFEQTIGPVSFPMPAQQAGFNREVFCRSLTP